MQTETERFFYDESLSFSPKSKGIKPKYYHNFITKKILSDKSFSISQETHKKTSSLLFSAKTLQRPKHALNKTSVIGLNSPENSKQNRIKTEPKEQSKESYGTFLRSSLTQSKLMSPKPAKNTKEEICRFYVEILRRVELINFRRSQNKASSFIIILQIIREV